MRNRVLQRETGSALEPRYFVNAVGNGLALLELFAGTERGLSLMEVARALGWTKATTFRHLVTLVDLGYLEAEPVTRRYRLTVKVLRLGGGYLSALSIPQLATPALERLSARFEESTNLAVLDDTDVVYVARVGSKRILSTNLGVGSRLPAYCTSMGKVLLAWLDDRRQREVLARVRFVRRTPKTVSGAAKLRVALRAIRRQGWAVNDQELDLGLRACSAPVLDRTGAAVAAVNLSVSTARTTLADVHARYVPAVVETAREISEIVRSRL